MNSLTKKFLIVIVALIVVGGAYVYFRHTSAQKLSYEAPSGLSAFSNEASDAASTIDSDSDGLPDWQELVMGTDPNKADTDGDGTSDGEEVKEGRDPKVAGPNDKLATTTVSAELDSSNATSKFSQDLLLEYYKLIQSGDTSKDAVDKMMQNVIAKGEIDIKAPVYSTSDFQTSDESNATIKNYGNNLGFALAAGSANSTEGELTILEAAAKDNDPSKLSDLEPISKSYADVAKALLSVQVPPSALYTHIDLANNFSSISLAIHDMEKFFSDPVTAVAAIRKYQQAIPAMVSDIQSLQLYFSGRGITYTSKEPGYIVTHASFGI